MEDDGRVGSEAELNFPIPTPQLRRQDGADYRGYAARVIGFGARNGVPQYSS
jgi:hypothetical protein